MSEIKVNSIKGVGASTAAITVNNSDGTCTANVTNNLSNRNLIINGAMQVAQRGTSSTAANYGSVDRFKHEHSNTDEAPTFAQVSLTSSDTPYTLGLTKAIKITNGNQTSGLQANSQINFNQMIEAQNIRNSGWNYKSSSSYITLSFWVRSSVSQNFSGFVKTADGSMYIYPYETGTLSADTWTKITKKIPGNSNLQIDDDNGSGFQVFTISTYGTDYTDNSVTYDQWAGWASSSRSKDQATTWYTTNDATLEITGVQLEVGSVATDFEHRSYAQELALCQRYYYRHAFGAAGRNIGIAAVYQANDIFPVVHFPCTMRTTPSLDVSNSSGYFRVYSDGASDAFDTFSSLWNTGDNAVGLNANSSNGVSGRTSGHAAMVITDNSSAHVSFKAEL